MEKQKAQTIKPWEAAARAGVATVLAAGMAGTPVVALADGEAQDDGGIQSLSTNDGYYYIDDSSYGLSYYLGQAASNGYTKVHVGTSFSDSGTVTIPSSLTEIAGYSEGFFSQGPKVVSIGYVGALSFVIPSDSDVSIDRVNFYAKSDDGGATVTVDAGAKVKFSNCAFSKTPVVNGEAIFEDCTFATGKIENNGTATYTGSTQEPENVSKPVDTYQSLSFVFAGDKAFAPAVERSSVDQKLAFSVAGTKAADAKFSAAVVDAGGKDVAGLSVTVENGQVLLSGTAPAAGSYQVKLTAEATKDDGLTDSVAEMLSFEVQQQIQVRLSGKLQCFVVDGTSMMGLDHDGIALASAGGGASGGSSSSENNRLDVEVKEGEGEWTAWNDWAKNDGERQDKVSVSISPEGSGMAAKVTMGSVFITGTPAKSGTYQVVATVTSGARTEQSNAVEMRIYDNDKTLAERIADLPEGTTSWDMEPYTIAETGNATVPTTLADIYGSHESGTYGTIGKGENGNFGTETLTIPAGADVTLHNMKVLSSVKIVVEKGAKLTLDDSVAYGTVEVSGGTVSAKNSSSFVGQIVLNDGSTLKDATIVSHANFLSDGNYQVKAPEAPVVVNGNVTFEGANSIAGCNITSGSDAQSALVVGKGATVTIPAGSSLVAKGGSVDTTGGNGGAGVKLDGGSIVGEGSLTATGGSVGLGLGSGGAGIGGQGKVGVATVVATGGNIPAAGEGSIGGPSKYKAGDGVAADVAVSQKSDITASGGQGATPGSSEVAKTYDPDAEGSDPAPSIEKRFRDVDPNAWYAPGVKKVADAGLMRGYSEVSLFGVGASLTRSELAMVLWRYSDPAAEGSYDASAAKNETSLPDVRDGVWYTGAVNWAVANGVMNGYADETGARTAFGPDDAVTMEQLLQILANLKGASNADEAALSSLVDAESISPWARSAAAWAIQQGVVSGYELPDGTHQLVPGELIARERVAAVLSNALEKGIL